jgi:hypothetical protein
VAPISTASGLTTVTTVTGFSMLLSAVLGVIVVSGEFRHNSAFSVVASRTTVLRDVT